MTKRGLLFLVLAFEAIPSLGSADPLGTTTALENLLYVPQNFASLKGFSDQSTYAYVMEEVNTDSGFVDIPGIGFWVDLDFPYQYQVGPCQCYGYGLERTSALRTYEDVSEATEEAVGETYFWSPQFLIGGGCVDPEYVSNVPTNWIVVLITNPDYPGWYDEDIPLPFLDEPIHSTTVSGNSPDVVDYTGKLPWQNGFMANQTTCAVTLSDLAFVTYPFCTGAYRFCADFITGGAGLKCDTTDCVFFTPYVKTGYTCTGQQ